MIRTFLSLALCQKVVLFFIRSDIRWPAARLLLDLKQGIYVATKEAISIRVGLLNCPVLSRPFEVPGFVRLKDDVTSVDGMVDFRGDPRSNDGPLFIGVRTRLVLSEFGTGATEWE